CLGLLYALAIGCSSDDDATFATCSAGQSIACAGPNGCEGFQTCLADGSAYGPCDCGAGGSGPGGTGGATSSGTGGAGGSTSSGTGGAGGSTSSGTAGSGGSSSGDCPVTPPKGGEDCSAETNGLWCFDGNDHCVCFWDYWDCVTCPPNQPQDGSGCSSQKAAHCLYGNTQCVCRGNSWACGQCPPSAPQHGSSCTAPGIVCAWGQDECTCGQDWDCDGW
ncbi:MAG: hypothetical protein JRI68_00175, partial [Deltaproteobacteria bacterium]|nr:hypothetical protein [Deltaproteobacteria bacterium]